VSFHGGKSGALVPKDFLIVLTLWGRDKGLYVGGGEKT